VSEYAVTPCLADPGDDFRHIFRCINGKRFPEDDIVEPSPGVFSVKACVQALQKFWDVAAGLCSAMDLLPFICSRFTASIILVPFYPGLSAFVASGIYFMQEWRLGDL
jgi:hypothetical protein